MGRFWMMLGCLFCGLSVMLGAFAAHVLKTTLDAESMAIFEVATRYMMLHGIALLALGLWSHWEKWAASFLPGLFFTLGILLFSGSLYTMVFIKIPWIVYATPVGGGFFLLGWLSFLFSIFTTRNKFI
ncbi:MAG: DUF423 domain-containing protein [Bdellovibrionaceae bacterium]|nr:DUF423 domain-containing protein [Pseudobdellovibrionaceae bacterium]